MTSVLNKMRVEAIYRSFISKIAEAADESKAVELIDELDEKAKAFVADEAEREQIYSNLQAQQEALMNDPETMKKLLEQAK